MITAWTAGNEGSRKLEDHLLSLALVTTHSFEPVAMHQYFNLSLDLEFIFLLSCSKVCLLSRGTPQAKGKFSPCFIVDFLNNLGMMRKLETLSDFCGLDDFKYLPKGMMMRDPLVNLGSDEL